MTLQEYIQSMRLRSKSDSRQYAFDGDFFERSARSSDLMADCLPLPPSIATAVGTFGNASRAPGRTTRYFGIGTRGAGVGWHSHTEGWLFGIQGAKRVFLYGPHTMPPLEYPSWRSQREWVRKATADMER